MEKLTQLGLDLNSIQRSDLAPVDEFHVRGHVLHLCRHRRHLWIKRNFEIEIFGQENTKYGQHNCVQISRLDKLDDGCREEAENE